MTAAQMPKAVAIAVGVIHGKTLEAGFKVSLVATASVVRDGAQSDRAREIGEQAIDRVLRLDRDLERHVGELRRRNRTECEMINALRGRPWEIDCEGDVIHVMD